MDLNIVIDALQKRLDHLNQQIFDGDESPGLEAKRNAVADDLSSYLHERHERESNG